MNRRHERRPSKAERAALIEAESAAAEAKAGPALEAEFDEEEAEGEEPVAVGEEFLLEGDDEGGRLDKWLSEQLPQVSRSFLRRCFDEGRIAKVPAGGGEPGAPLRASAHVEPRITYRVLLPPVEAAAPEPEAIPLAILYEDDHLIVVNKAPGMVVHPSPGHPTGTLVNALLAHCGDSLSGINGVRRPGIVHRLDQDTSGVLLVAKTDAAHRHLADQLRARTLRREYLALVEGESTADAGTIDTYLGRDPRQRLRRAVVPEGRSDARHAVTHWEVVERFYDAILMRCRLESGRTHQIRVHLASTGHAVIGDSLYGYRPDSLLGGQPTRMLQRFRSFLGTLDRQMLHAERLVLLHPATEEPLEVTAPVPRDMETLIALLRESAKL